jgi:hypothetical protein
MTTGDSCFAVSDDRKQKSIGCAPGWSDKTPHCEMRPSIRNFGRSEQFHVEAQRALHV